MKIPHTLLLFLLAGGLAVAQDEAGEDQELTPYSVTEINNFCDSFKATYKKGVEDDATSVVLEMGKAYRYIESKGDEATPEEKKAQARVVGLMVKGLKVRKRPLVTLECVRVLGEIGAAKANKDLTRWLEKVVDEKSPLPEWVEYGYLSIAWIGAKDKRTQYDLVLKYASTGKHMDMGVASHALKACSEYRELDGKTRKEFFQKIMGYMGGLWSGWKSGDPKKRAGYEKKYNAVEQTGLATLNELATYMLSDPPTAFKNPPEAFKWWNDGNKKRKWPTYVGPRFRKKAPAKKEDKPAKDKPA